MFVNRVCYPLHRDARGQGLPVLFSPQPRPSAQAAAGPRRLALSRVISCSHCVSLGVKVGLGSMSASLWHPADGRSFRTCAVASPGEGAGKVLSHPLKGVCLQVIGHVCSQSVDKGVTGPRLS